MQRLAKTDIKFLHGVGPKRAEMLAKQLDIHSYYDLLYYFPYRYVDKSKIHRIRDIEGDMPYIQLKGRFLTFTVNGEGVRKRLNALFSDGTGTIEVVWFNRVKQIQESYHTGVDYVIFGKPTEFNRHFSISHPEVEQYRPDAPQQGFKGIYTIPETLRNRSFTSRNLQQMVTTLIAGLGRIDETLPAHIIDRLKLMPIREALINIHIPESVEKLQKAQFRLKFEELFYLQLNILKFARNRSMSLAGFRFTRVGECFNRFYNEVLPFPLTGAQKRVIKEIRADMGSGRQMNRLLQGDVGSGKTLVALMTMLLAVDNGYQACMMAPTEILAGQHYSTISGMAQKIGVRVELLTGSTKKKERDEIHEGLMNGDVKILIGTHALIEDTVNFKNLGMAVIDEQHRFGVAQRAKMWKKNVTPPHVLVMTATPIPRTLAMTVYGDLNVSVLDELPPGRKPVHTKRVESHDRSRLFSLLENEIAHGHQVYYVFPLIKENEKMDLRDLENGYEGLCKQFPNRRIAYVHGRMSSEEKSEVMTRFANGQTDILVATTVIEVGVNVPNATVMVIEGAQRFGLSQLHQLRGRVGRNADQAYCFLVTPDKLSGDTRKRIDIMTMTNDGFKIAEEDLQIRGPGDLQGTMQSGIPFNLKIANLVTDGKLLEEARRIAHEVISSDPQHNHSYNDVIWKQLKLQRRNDIDWEEIS